MAHCIVVMGLAAVSLRLFCAFALFLLCTVGSLPSV